MQDWIAGAMAVLGVLLVLGGGSVIVLKAMATESSPGTPPVEPDTPVPATTRLVNAVRGMPAADRLIGWGIVLLVLGAVAAGAIAFNLDAGAGTR